jgi:glycine cleavage system H protein
MLVPDDLKYAKSHEWIRVQDDTATVGITELPKPGTPLAAGQAAAIVESVKAASDIYSPVSGEVVELNPELETNPALLNTDPYGAGWLFKLRIKDARELDTLQEPAAYREQIGA